jgi:hypothetical protein
MLAVPNKQQPGDTLRTTSKNRNDVLLHSLYVGVVEKLLPHNSQGSSMERWSRNTLRVVTARVFYVLRGF